MAEKSTASRATQFSAFNLLTAWEQPICGNVATPFVDSQTIYLSCEHAYIFALNPNAAGDHHVRWRYEVRDSRLTAMESLDDGVLVGSDSNLCALDGSSGQIRWQYKLRALGSKSGAFLMPSVAQVKYASPYIHFLNHSGLFTLDSRTGEERHFTSSWREWEHLTADTNLIYVTDKYNGTVEALAPGISWPSWYFECGAGIKVAPALDDSFLYCASHNGYLHVIEKQTGQLRASIQLDAPPAAIPVSGGNDSLFVVTEQGSVMAFDIARLREPSPSSETWLWRFDTQEESLRSPLLFDATLFVTTKDGVIYGLDAQTGALIWQYDLDTTGRLELCRYRDTLIAATSGKVVGFRPAPGFGSQSKMARSPQPEWQPTVTRTDAEEDLISPAVFLPPVDLKLPEVSLPQQVWSISLPAQVATGIVTGPSHVVVGCEDHKLLSVNAENGSILWQIELEGDLQEIWPVSPNDLCVADKRDLYCFDAATGGLRWRRHTDGPVQSGADIGHCAVFYTPDGARLVCVNNATGEVVWEREGEEGSRPCRPCSNGVLLFTAGKHGVHALFRESGEESWFSPCVREVTSPLFHLKGRVFAGSSDGRLYAFDAGSGELLWVFKTKDQIFFPPVELTHDLIVIAAQDQFVYALNSGGGTLRWRHALGSLPCGEPCVADETIFIGTTEGLICALNAHSGRLNWKHKLGGEKLKAGPAVADSYLYAANDIGSLICLRHPPRA